jgi:copper resistance protein B
VRADGLIGFAVCLWFSAGLALSAEDHSQHRAEPTRTDAVDPHAHHKQSQRETTTESERAHVPPPPPSLVMGPMSNERMIELMQMEDDAPLGMIAIDEIEWRALDGKDAQAWEAYAWYGTDYHKLWLKTAGERVDGEAAGRVELLWDRIFTPWWSLQVGLREDFSAGTSRTWAAIGAQGLAPYLFEVEAMLYVGEEGRTAGRFSAEYDMRFTQRLVLRPHVELNAYGSDDADNDIGSGLSELAVGLRLRYELRREFAPYVGMEWERKIGSTADLIRASGHDASELSFVAGLRAWF